MDNTSTVNLNTSDILPLQETTMGCNATNMSLVCDVHGGNQTDHLFHSFLWVTELSFMCFDVLNVLGNAVLMLLINKASTKNEASGRLLTNQVVSDAGIGLSFIVVSGIMFSDPHIDILQTAMFAQRVVLARLYCESGLTLAMTLFTLHIAVCNPIFYKVSLKPIHITVSIVISWIVATGSSMSIFATVNFNNDSFFALKNTDVQNIWFIIFSAITHIILPLAMIIIAYTRICLYMRKQENVSIASSSDTMRFVRQAKGILIVCITYMVTFVPLFTFWDISMYIYDKDIRSIIIGNILAFINYMYLVFKLPLFLLAFPSYRRVASRIFCHHLASKSGSSGEGSQSSQSKYKAATDTNDRSDDDGFQRSVEGARSRSTIEIMDDIGKTNHAFTSTCSVNDDDTTRTRDDDVTSTFRTNDAAST